MLSAGRGFQAVRGGEARQHDEPPADDVSGIATVIRLPFGPTGFDQAFAHNHSGRAGGIPATIAIDSGDYDASEDTVFFVTLQKRRLKSLPSSKNTKRKPGSTKKAHLRRAVALAEGKDDLSKYLRLAADEEIVITRHGRPAGVLIGFDSEEGWFEYRLEHHPEFLGRIAESRAALREGRGVRLEDV